MRAARFKASHAGVGTLLVLLVPAAAWAAPTAQDEALALQLFDAGRTLLASGKVDEACRDLQESQRLDPLPGTLLNLAVCHEAQGRSASAVAEFREARSLAQRDGRQDRVFLADQHLRTLESKVSSVVITVPADADRPDLVVTRDATEVGRAAWGTRIPVDPGQHVIEASAANKKPMRVALTIGPGGDVQTVTVKPLEDAPPSPTPVSAPPSPAPAAAPAPVGLSTQAPPGPQPAHGLSTRRTLGLISAGTGVVWLGIGTYFGVSALSKHKDSANACTTVPCSESSVAANSSAETFADVSTVSFAVGLVGLGLGAFLWLGDSSGESDKAAIRVEPDVALGRAGLDVSGRF